MVAMGVFDYLPQERVIFGRPAAEAVAAEARARGARRVFLITSRTMSQKTEVVAGVRAALGNHFAGLYDDNAPHSPREIVVGAANAAREAGADLLVTIGGGSPIDTTKVVQICLANGIDTVEELGRYCTTGDKAAAAMAPSPARQIAVPTTLSGGEWTNLAGVTDMRRHVKELYAGRDICPVAVVLDPAATLHTPDWLWLSTGMRAVDHAVEGLCAPAAHPFADGLHLHALRLLSQSLRRNKEAPEDLDARLLSQQGVWLASAAIGRVPFGASHGIGHALGGSADVPHGYTSCVMLPAVLRWNEPVNGARQRLVAEALGRPDLSAAEAVAELVRDLGLPGSLAEVGVARAQWPRIAEVAVQSPWVKANPRPVRGVEDVLEILELAA